MMINVKEKIKQGHEIGSNRDAIDRGAARAEAWYEITK